MLYCVSMKRKKLFNCLSHNALITWSWEIKWRPKINISPLPQCLWPPNLTGWWLTSKYSYLKQNMKFESRDLGKSFDKSKTSPLPQWLFPPNFGMLSFHAELPPIKLQVIFVFIQRRKMLQLNRTHPSTSNSKEKRRTWCHYSDISFYSEVIKKES